MLRSNFSIMGFEFHNDVLIKSLQFVDGEIAIDPKTA